MKPQRTFTSATAATEWEDEESKDNDEILI
jgi:hypothetical protein